MNAAFLATALVRLGLVLLFLPFSALDKIIGFKHAVGQAREVFKPHTLAVAVILCGLGVEIFCSLGVITGVGDRLCALILAGYCVVTAALYKRFWAQGDFWSNADGKGRSLFWDFLKNCALASGFLLIVIGTDGRGLNPFLESPFASIHSYQHSSSISEPINRQ